MAALSDWVQGSVRPSMALTWYQDDETPMDLTNSVITGVIRNVYTNESRAIAGNLELTDADGGVFRWDLDDADVAEYGKFLVQFTATFGAGQTPAKTFSADWLIERSLVAS